MGLLEFTLKTLLTGVKLRETQSREQKLKGELNKTQNTLAEMELEKNLDDLSKENRALYKELDMVNANLNKATEAFENARLAKEELEKKLSDTQSREAKLLGELETIKTSLNQNLTRKKTQVQPYRN